MAVTTTKTDSVANAMNTGNPASIANAIEQMKLGRMLTPQKWTTVGLTSASAFDLTTAAVAAAATAGPSTSALATGERLQAALSAAGVAVRVTAGAAAAGPRIVTDSGGTPSATVATLSADGKTITFEAGVTAFVIEYIPRSEKAMIAAFATT